MKLFFGVLIASTAYACQREHVLERHVDVAQILLRRETTSVAPSDQNEALLLGSFDNVTLDEWSYYYTHGLHVAGTNESQAQWTADRFAEHGFTAPPLAQYYTYLSYPVSHSLALTASNGTTYDFDLEEAILPEDSTTSYPNRVPIFHGYAASGTVSAEYVYVGRGQQVDFDRLIALGVPLEGKIALSRYGGPFRGLKVKNAQAHGMIGAVLFTDTGDDGNITEAKGYAAYPDGPARNPTSVQRGSVMFLSIYSGDPTTPGYPSKEGSPRTNISVVTPEIPSIPVSWTNGQKLIQMLDGHGTPGAEVNRTRWVGAFNSSYSTGPAPGVTLALDNQMRSEITWIWDAIGYINGTEYPDEAVVIGNHRDAWIVGGAADPNSGTACLVELSKAFGKLLATGWRPKRTIVLASWDGEEYGLLGSTEWVEEYIPWLNASAVSYLNIDIGTSGPNPDLSATPDLHALATSTMQKVPYPHYYNTTGLSLFDVWTTVTGGAIGVLGSGSDYTAFVHTVGTSSLDVGAYPGPTDPIYHYHSNYDSYHWISTFADPGFRTHKVMGQYLTLLAYRLASADILPLDPANYGVQMSLYLLDLQDTISTAQQTPSPSSNSTSPAPVDTSIDLTPLITAISNFNASAAALSTLIASSSSSSPAHVPAINAALRDYQRAFLDPQGLPGRPFYKHVVFAPGLDTGYAPVTFPGVTEQVAAGEWGVAREWVGRTAAAVEKAAGVLRGAVEECGRAE